MPTSDSEPFAESGELVAAATLFRDLSHPLRLEILCAFGDGVWSPSQLQQGLDVTLGLVAYHVRKLRDEDLVELVAKRPVRGSVESFYRLSDRGRWACASLDAVLAIVRDESSPAQDVLSLVRRAGASIRLEAEQRRVEAAEQRAEAAAVRAESRQARRHAHQLRARLGHEPPT